MGAVPLGGIASALATAVTMSSGAACMVSGGSALSRVNAGGDAPMTLTVPRGMPQDW